MIHLSGRLRLATEALPLPNSRGWRTSRFEFSLFPGDPSRLVRAQMLPRDAPREFGVITGCLGNRAQVVIPVLVNGETIPVLFQIASFTKRMGIDPSTYAEEAILALALRKMALKKALPQLSDAEVDAIFERNLPQNSPVRRVEQRGEDLIVEVEEWGLIRGSFSECRRFWNCTRGGFERGVGEEFSKENPLLQLNREGADRRGLFLEGIEQLERFIRSEYAGCWAEIYRTKQDVIRQLPLPEGSPSSPCTIRFERSGRVTVQWTSFRFGATKMYDYSWQVFGGRAVPVENPQRLSSVSKVGLYLRTMPAQFLHRLQGKAADVGLSQEECGAIAEVIRRSYPRAGVYEVGARRIEIEANGKILLRLGERPCAVFEVRGQNPRITPGNVSWDLLEHVFEHPFQRTNREFFERNSTMVHDNLFLGGMSGSVANAVNAYVTEHYERIMHQVLSLGRTYTVRRGTEGLPCSLEFGPRNAWAKVKHVGRHPSGTTKKGKQAVSVWEEGKRVMRLVAHPEPGDPRLEMRLRQELELLTTLNQAGIPGLVKPIELVPSINKGGAPTLVLYEERCNLGDMEKHIFHLSQEQRRDVMGGLLESLARLHGEGVAHRDIKPGNVFLNAERWAKFSPELSISAFFGDFDLAIHARPPRQVGIAGTIAYLPPEKAKALLENRTLPSEREFSGDVWALGVVFAEMWGVPGAAKDFSGQRIVLHGDPQERRQAELFGGREERMLRYLSELRPTPENQSRVVSGVVSEQTLDALIRDMLQIDPSQRITAHGAWLRWQQIEARRKAGRENPVFQGVPPIPLRQAVEEEQEARGSPHRAVIVHNRF